MSAVATRLEPATSQWFGEEAQMYETHLTAVGTLITAVDKRRLADGTTKVSFRIACNERRFDRAANGWTSGDTLYLSVSCWRGLADNVHASFVSGDPIIVRGRLVTREWEKDGRRQSMTELEASAVGADLSRCTAKVMRTKRGGQATDEGRAGGSDGAVPAAAEWARADDPAADPAAEGAQPPGLAGRPVALARPDPEGDPGQSGRLGGAASGDADAYPDGAESPEAGPGCRDAFVEVAVGA